MILPISKNLTVPDSHNFQSIRFRVWDFKFRVEGIM